MRRTLQESTVVPDDCRHMQYSTACHPPAYTLDGKGICSTLEGDPTRTNAMRRPRGLEE